jgi:hypothetical protein
MGPAQKPRTAAMDSPSGASAGHGRGCGEEDARDPWPLLLELRNEQRFVRHTLELLLRRLGHAGPGPRPAPPEPPELRGRREARGLKVIRRALARREARGGGGP